MMTAIFRIVRQAVFIVGLTLLASACRTDRATEASTAHPPSRSHVAPADETLYGGTWGGDRKAAMASGKPWIQMKSSGTFSAFDGCSRIAGIWTFHTSDGSATTKITTAMGTSCEDSRRADFSILTIDRGKLQYRVDGNERSLDRH